MGRMNSNCSPVHPTSLSAVSRISSGSPEHNVCSPGAQERFQRSRRNRNTNSSPASQTSKNVLTSNEQFVPRNHSKRSSPPSCRNQPASLSMSPGRQPAYAGAKFGDAPSPSVLPLPPARWLNSDYLQLSLVTPCQNLTSEIKTLLQVA